MADAVQSETDSRVEGGGEEEEQEEEERLKRLRTQSVVRHSTFTATEFSKNGFPKSLRLSLGGAAPAVFFFQKVLRNFRDARTLQSRKAKKKKSTITRR